MKRIPAAAFFLLALSAAAACGNDFTTFGDDPGGDTSGSGGSDAPSASSAGGGDAMCVDFGDACTTCERQACETSFCECYGNVDCGLYAACTFACEAWDYDCYQACNTAHPDGITDAVLLNDCAFESCDSECADYPLIELTACERCTYESCEAQMNTCLANPACTELTFCMQDCVGNRACYEQCYAAHPGGIADIAPVGQCATASCSDLCGL